MAWIVKRSSQGKHRYSDKSNATNAKMQAPPARLEVSDSFCTRTIALDEFDRMPALRASVLSKQYT